MNVIPGDFTHSGKLDLLVLSHNQARSQLDLVLYPSVISGGFGDFVLCLACFRAENPSDIDNPVAIDASSLSQPIVVDMNGDMKIDLLGMTAASEGNPDVSLKMWKNVWNDSSDARSLFQL